MDRDFLAFLGFAVIFALLGNFGWMRYHWVQAQAAQAAQAAPAPAKLDLTPTEVELLRLQVKQRDAELAQVTLAQAQANFQKAVADFNAEVDATKKAHDWPADVQVDPAALRQRQIKFVQAPAVPPPIKAPVPKPLVPAAPSAGAKETK